MLVAPLAVIVGAAVAVGGCGAGRPAPPHGGSFVPDDVPPAVTSALCTPARASEDLRPRAELTGTGMLDSGDGAVMHTSDLFARFNGICGGCHVASANGGRHADEATFAAVFDAGWLQPVTSDDPAVYMPPPPNGKPFSSRAPGDPVRDLVGYLQQWIAQGKPSDVFTVTGGAAAGSGSGNYAFTPDVGAAMTNLGNCIPAPSLVASSVSGDMEAKDAMFAQATELPQNLADTDLTTFDAQTLAQNGVIAYVPTYPLWSAGSGKLRHVRVPRGQTVKFDKATQTFDIPPNTRFYKTFFRKIVDRAGNLANRKMETRVIVARPDRTLADGTVEQTALYGTYVWSEDELSATLANIPYRDGTPFADQIRTYFTDELTYQEIVDGIPPGANFDGALASALQMMDPDHQLQQHYAIPGRIRCMQCHMGSPTKDFVLGFFPLQVARRASGTGGTYEPTGADELDQLQRLIDYGVISGMTSPADVLPLEQSQGTRRPRTDAELTAQAYMVGNCAHCHNPRGFPSVTKPDLATVLDFLPDGAEGGIFQMSLERMSPIRARGANNDIPIPYITPSLRDYPVADQGLARLDNGVSIDPGGSEAIPPTWTPKYLPGSDCTLAAKDKMTRAYCGDRRTGNTFVPAPWRSLIYRNVDTPFPYFDDFVPFPRMPMNTFGYDCRAPRIMGEWMVGLPALPKNPRVSENTIPRQGAKVGDGTFQDDPQPYREVAPDDPDYGQALIAAQERLRDYKAGVRYAYCETEWSPDIFDPTPRSPYHDYLPNPARYLPGGIPPDDPDHPSEYLAPPIGVPYHSHFFNYDPTDLPPPYQPRRADWQPIVVDQVPDTALPAGIPALTASIARDRRIAIQAIDGASLSDDLRKFATTPVPFGLWVTKPECQQTLAANQVKVSAYTGVPAQWMLDQKPSPDAYLYMMSPGRAIYRNVCYNCHGPKHDGRGLQADALAASSEGEARPANFHEGLFGPSTQPGADVMSAFSVASATNVDPVTWAARYMAWMALGGTLQRIPQDIIYQVEATTVLGARRQNLSQLPVAAQGASANMLNLAKGLCSVVLPDPTGQFSGTDQDFGVDKGPDAYPPFNSESAPFIRSNGDRELWLALCSRFSPQVVRVYTAAAKNVTSTQVRYYASLDAFYYATGDAPGSSYPSDAPVLDHERVVQQGVHPDNYYPACLRPPDPVAAADLQNQPIRAAYHMPDCPASFLANGTVLWDRRNSTVMQDNAARWPVSGATAAGMAVFSYLRCGEHADGTCDVPNGGSQVTEKPFYNECQLLR